MNIWGNDATEGVTKNLRTDETHVPERKHNKQCKPHSLQNESNLVEMS